MSPNGTPCARFLDLLRSLQCTNTQALARAVVYECSLNAVSLFADDAVRIRGGGTTARAGGFARAHTVQQCPLAATVAVRTWFLGLFGLGFLGRAYIAANGTKHATTTALALGGFFLGCHGDGNVADGIAGSTDSCKVVCTLALQARPLCALRVFGGGSGGTTRHLRDAAAALTTSSSWLGCFAVGRGISVAHVWCRISVTQVRRAITISHIAGVRCMEGR